MAPDVLHAGVAPAALSWRPFPCPEPVMPGPSVVHFPCPHCLCQLKAAAAVVGRTTACPVCDHELVVPPPPPPRATDDTQLSGLRPLSDPPPAGG